MLDNKQAIDQRNINGAVSFGGGGGGGGRGGKSRAPSAHECFGFSNPIAVGVCLLTSPKNLNEGHDEELQRQREEEWVVNSTRG